jgi:hypothetical protein
VSWATSGDGNGHAVRLDELRKIVCVGCGRADRPLKKLASMSHNLRACDLCLARYGAAHLALEADAALANATTVRPLPGKCLHCGEPMLANANGTTNVWCQDCDREAKALLGR